MTGKENTWRNVAFSRIWTSWRTARTEHNANNKRLQSSSTRAQAFVISPPQILQTEPTFLIFLHGGDSLVHTALSREARFTKHVAYAYYVGHEIITPQFTVRLQDYRSYEATFGGATSRTCHNGLTHNFAWVMLSQVPVMTSPPLRFKSVHIKITDGGFRKWWLKCYWTLRLTVYFLLQFLPFLWRHMAWLTRRHVSEIPFLADFQGRSETRSVFHELQRQVSGRHKLMKHEADYMGCVLRPEP
jgi:hypothetical protein